MGLSISTTSQLCGSFPVTSQVCSVICMTSGVIDLSRFQLLFSAYRCDHIQNLKVVEEYSIDCLCVSGQGYKVASSSLLETS